MGGGLIQLIAIGPQDVFLTGNPQISFFKMVYKKYTNFSKECIIQNFSGGGDKITCTLARNGDLIQEIYLKITYKITPLNLLITDTTIDPNNRLSINIYNVTNNLITTSDYINLNINDPVYFDYTGTFTGIIKNKIYYINYININNTSITFSLKNINNEHISCSPVGALSITLHKIKNNYDLTNLIDYIEIDIGGQIIDKHYSPWLDIYNELLEKQQINNIKLHNLYNMNIDENGLFKDINTIYIPLRFWFNKYPGLALPLISLQYNDVKIHLNKKNINDEIKKYDIKLDNISHELLVNYIFLDIDERKRFSSTSHEYLIEQVQHTGEEILKLNKNFIDLTFNHPIKALYWKTNGDAYIKDINITFNGKDRFIKQDENYFHLVQPYENNLNNQGYKINTKTRIWSLNNTACSNEYSTGMYSFCLKPNEYHPSGSCNFSRIDSSRFNYFGVGTTGTTNTLYIYAVNYNVLRIINGMAGLVYSN